MSNKFAKFIRPGLRVLQGLALSVLFAVPVHATVVINEFSSGTSSDWVELYNTGTASADLSIYRLRDSTDSNKKDLSGSLSSGGITSFSFSNYLNNGGDTIKFIRIENESEIIEEQISYGDVGGLCASSESQSIGKLPDGSSTIVRFSSSTRDATNNSSQEPCISPTSTSAPTVTLTKSPTITSTSAPTNTPTPTPASKIIVTNTPTPTKKGTPTYTPTQTTSPTPLAEVLGLGVDTSASRESSPSANAFPIKPMIISLLFVGAGLALLSIVFILKKRKTLGEKSES